VTRTRSLLARVAAGAGVVLLVAVVGLLGKAWYDSRIPDTYSVMDFGEVDDGGGSPVGEHALHGGGVSVAALRGPRGVPDARYTLVAQQAEIRLASGRAVEALTFNGRSPGPELRVKQGDLVEVVLVNKDVSSGVTIHWHGVDLPNAEDGVAGVTQDAVLSGERHVYRFRAEQVGTFWYHTHQVSSKEVRRGLFGTFVIEPRVRPEGLDLTAVVHTYNGVPTLNLNDSPGRLKVAVGTPVRMRLVNTDSSQQTVTVSGTTFRVLAIDGTDLTGPTELENVALPLAAGGRVDVGYVQPPRGVRIGVEGTGAALGLSPDRAPPADEEPAAGEFDPLTYGARTPTPFREQGRFDRRFELTISRKFGFYDGRPGRQWAINGGIYPDVPVFAVEEGDRVQVTIANKTNVVHPMHLHGHHVLVLSRDGKPATGSPWWSDTLNVRPGERYVVAFKADNPGIWMDHCHNLPHAARGLTMHVAYVGIRTPYRVGAEHDNTPE
jgi:FtsP/CotA-like multicopper oxidase with cupredoxin domain